MPFFVLVRFFFGKGAMLNSLWRYVLSDCIDQGYPPGVMRPGCAVTRRFVQVDTTLETNAEAVDLTQWLHGERQKDGLAYGFR